ncbi:invasin [Klebsiella pneumoniae]|uniref:Invasin n=1 Tax=Klebsiella pneumoniae TaxID=573 RepID=A0A508ZQV2_KLEPN|nr:invasin [Klebsiella pneumoniae]
MPVSFRLLPTLTFLLLLPGVPVWALTASDTTRPAQAQDPLPDMGIAPQVDDDARHFAEVAKKFGEASMSDNGLTAGEQAAAVCHQ